MSGIKLDVPPLCGGVYSGVVSGLDFTGISLLVCFFLSSEWRVYGWCGYYCFLWCGSLEDCKGWRAVCLEYNAVYGVTLLGFTWVLSLSWLLVFSESLKDCFRGNGLGVIKVVARCKLGVNVISFNRI